METSKTKELTNFHYISLTDVGARRTNNEDYQGYFDTVNGHVFVVCDGCGGLPCGERASMGVVNSIKFFFNNYYYKDPKEAIKDAINYAQNRLIDEGRQDPECAGMATTVVLVLIRFNKVYYAHVGDSRIYLFSRRELRQLTTDDSYVQYLVSRGELSPDQAETHPRKNELTQVMGMTPAPVPHVCAEPLDPNEGELLLLCTDGLYNMVSLDDMRATLLRRGYIEDKGMDLMKTAIANGGYDNITLQIIKFFNLNTVTDKTEQTPVYEDKDSHRRTPITIAILSVILVILGVLFYLKETKRQELMQDHAAGINGQTIKYQLDTLADADSVLNAFGIDRTQAVFSVENSQQIMCVPIKKVITIRYYDNLTTLEKLYGTPREKIIKVNDIRDGHLEPGQQIIIPL